jgi:hypothetical protein
MDFITDFVICLTLRTGLQTLSSTNKNRQLFEVDYTDEDTGVVVHPLFVQTASLVP